MNLIEKLEQEIESLENSFEQFAIVDNEIAMVHTATIAGLKMAINIAKQHSEWVSVDERLPEDNQEVLAILELTGFYMLSFVSNGIGITLMMANK